MTANFNIWVGLILIGMAGGLCAGCGPRRDLDGWLTRKDGRWEVAGGLMREVQYASSIDSVITDPEPITGTGFFRFTDGEANEYAFDMLGFRWTGQFSFTPRGEYVEARARDFAPNFNAAKVTFTALDADRHTVRVNFRYDDVLPSSNRYVVLATIDLKRPED